eukprot:GHVN01050618.1.p1 GENE.GHVN01050618.1~~GHVN01050618.1.p1  ORF type:complete len:1256 (-),score=339.45 GHVN01050618.1:1267-5034(-)
MFASFILQSIWKVYDSCVVNPCPSEQRKIGQSVGLAKLMTCDKPMGHPEACGIEIAKTVLSHWLPLSDGALKMIVEHLPSPITAAPHRLPYLCPSLNSLCDDSPPSNSHDSKSLSLTSLRDGLLQCDPTANTVVFIARFLGADLVLMRLTSDKLEGCKAMEGFVGVGRCFSGRLRVGDKLMICSTAHTLRKNTGNTRRRRQSVSQVNKTSAHYVGEVNDVKKASEVVESSDERETVVVRRLFYLMGRDLMPIDQVTAGATFAMNVSTSDPTSPEASILNILAWILSLRDPHSHNRLRTSSSSSPNDAQSSEVCGVRGRELTSIDRCVTLSDNPECPPFADPYNHSRWSTIMRVSIEPVSVKQMDDMLRGLALLYKADPAVEIDVLDTGEHVLGCCGEVHLERCLNDLKQIYTPNVALNVSEPLVAVRECVAAWEAGYSRLGEVGQTGERGDLTQSGVVASLTEAVCGKVPFPPWAPNLMDSKVSKVGEEGDREEGKRKGAEKSESKRSWKQKEHIEVREMGNEVKESVEYSDGKQEGAERVPMTSLTSKDEVDVKSESVSNKNEDDDDDDDEDDDDDDVYFLDEEYKEFCQEYFNEHGVWPNEKEVKEEGEVKEVSDEGDVDFGERREYGFGRFKALVPFTRTIKQKGPSLSVSQRQSRRRQRDRGVGEVTPLPLPVDLIKKGVVQGVSRSGTVKIAIRAEPMPETALEWLDSNAVNIQQLLHQRSPPQQIIDEMKERKARQANQSNSLISVEAHIDDGDDDVHLCFNEIQKQFVEAWKGERRVEGGRVSEEVSGMSGGDRGAVGVLSSSDASSGPEIGASGPPGELWGIGVNRGSRCVLLWGNYGGERQTGKTKRGKRGKGCSSVSRGVHDQHRWCMSTLTYNNNNLKNVNYLRVNQILDKWSLENSYGGGRKGGEAPDAVSSDPVGSNTSVSESRHMLSQSQHEVWSDGKCGDMSGVDEQISEIVSQVMNEMVSGFEIACQKGPLCEEPIRGVVFILEVLQFNFCLKEDEPNHQADASGHTVLTKVGETNISSPSRCSASPNPISPPTHSEGGGLSAVGERASEVIESSVSASRAPASGVLLDRDVSVQMLIPIRDCIRDSILQRGRCRIVEGMLRLELNIEEDVLGRAYDVLAKRRAQVINQTLREGTSTFRVEAKIPVSTSFGLGHELRTHAKGDVSLHLQFSHWEVIEMDPFPEASMTEEEVEVDGEGLMQLPPNVARQTINAIRKRKGLPVEDKVVVAAEKQRTLGRNV